MEVFMCERKSGGDNGKANGVRRESRKRKIDSTNQAS
jgi:hypothetical protein